MWREISYCRLDGQTAHEERQVGPGVCRPCVGGVNELWNVQCTSVHV